MAATFDALKADIRKGDFAPVYFLYGEEGYFIDQLAELLEREVLAGAEPSFNLDVFYGPDTQGAQLVAAARGYPVMAARRLVLVKEAQKLRKDDAEKLVGYLEQPSPTTVLALLHKDKKKPDQRTKYGKAVTGKGVAVLESKALYDNQVPGWVEAELRRRGMGIDADALHLLVASLGTQLTRIVSELDKLALALAGRPAPHVIDRRLVSEAVGVDKEFNVFELLNHIGARQVYQAHFTLDQMLRNPKANPPILILAQVSGFFTKLGLLRHQNIQDENGVASTLRIHPFIARQYVMALRQYSYGHILAALRAVQQADLALKGIEGPDDLGEEHILKTMLFQVLQAPQLA